MMDVLFESTLGNHFKDLNPTALPNSVDSVGRLILFSRVPPPIVVDHDRSRNEIDPNTSRLKRSDKDFTLRIIKKTDNLLFQIACRTPYSSISNFVFF